MSTDTLPTPKERNIYLTGDVLQSSMNRLTKEILEIERDDKRLQRIYKEHGLSYKPKHINFYIDTYGGAVYACFGLISVMDLCTTPIRTIVTGCAMSCGYIITIHGHERVAYPNSTIMYHQVSNYSEGKIADIEQDTAETLRLQTKLEDMTLKRTKITKDQLIENYNTKVDWFMTAGQALKLGVVDKIAKSNIF